VIVPVPPDEASAARPLTSAAVFSLVRRRAS
jgi:hypothetical protein